MRHRVLLCVAAILPARLLAQMGAPRTGLEFLKIAVGPRAVAMGEAFVAVADDATAAYWNPAGLAGLDSPEVLFAHTAYFADIAQEYVAAVTEAGPVRIAGSLNLLNLGLIERRDVSGELDGEGFRPLDVALGGSVAYSVREDLDVGGTVKGILEDIDTESATGILGDVGALWRPPVEGLTLGVAVQNLGPALTFIAEPFDPPRTLLAGASYARELTGWESGLLLSLQVTAPRDDDVRVQVGGEWSYGAHLVGRAGVIGRAEEQDFTAGLGARYRRFEVDYAFAPYSSSLGNTHRIGLRYRFPSR